MTARFEEEERLGSLSVDTLFSHTHWADQKLQCESQSVRVSVEVVEWQPYLCAKTIRQLGA